MSLNIPLDFFLIHEATKILSRKLQDFAAIIYLINDTTHLQPAKAIPLFLKIFYKQFRMLRIRRFGFKIGPCTILYRPSDIL